MNYNISNILKKCSISEKALHAYAQVVNVKIPKTRLIDKNNYQLLMNFVEQTQGIHLPKSLPIFFLDKEGISLYNDDAIVFLKSLPDKSVDIITTDPAYSGMNNKLQLGKGRIVGRYKDKGTINGKWFTEFEDTENNYSAFLNECKRILTPMGHIYIMFDSFSLLTLGPLVRKYFSIKNLLTWDKVNMGMGHYFRRRHEYIIFATNNNNRHIRDRCFPDIWRFKRIHNSKYPTQKPVELFETMIYASALPNSKTVVCDPFAGSCSAAIASLKNNCQFIGCDISGKALNLSKQRILEYIQTNIDPLQPNTSAICGEKIFWRAKNG